MLKKERDESMNEEMKENLEENMEEEELSEEIQEEEMPEEAEVLDPAKLAAELEELNNRFLRVSADFENYKRRTVQEKEDLRKYSNAKLIESMLPVLDTFQIALKSQAESDEAKNILKGVEMVQRQMLQVLEQAGLTKIEAVGNLFDPNLHEAIMQVEDDTVPEDTVIEELRAGYTLNERVIRAAMVKVSR